MTKDSAAQIELGRLFHQEETVKEKASDSVSVPLWDGTTMRLSLAECKLLDWRAHKCLELDVRLLTTSAN